MENQLKNLVEFRNTLRSNMQEQLLLKNASLSFKENKNSSEKNIIISEKDKSKLISNETNKNQGKIIRFNSLKRINNNLENFQENGQNEFNIKKIKDIKNKIMQINEKSPNFTKEFRKYISF